MATRKTNKATKQKTTAKSAVKMTTITSENRLQAMLTEAETELETIQPKIEKLEKQLERLKGLKLEKQKLITLKLSIKAILENFHSNAADVNTIFDLGTTASPAYSSANSEPSQAPEYRKQKNRRSYSAGIFIPEEAFKAVEAILKRKQSINFEIYKAVVYKGGQASTEDVRDYLVENNVALPGTGEGFQSISLSELASRIHYLIRKEVLQSPARGVYQTVYGWKAS